MSTANILRNFLLTLSLLLSTCIHAGVYWGVGGGFGGGYYHGYPGPGCCGGYGWGWGPPNIIINAPVVPPPTYVIECETVEVCDNYTDECWLERRCN